MSASSVVAPANALVASSRAAALGAEGWVQGEKGVDGGAVRLTGTYR